MMISFIIIMSEELSYELYKWLSSIEVVPPTLRYKTNGNYELDHKTTEGLLSGFLIAKLLNHLALETGTTLNQPLLSSIKHSGTPAARMYNWNILNESFLKMNIQVPKQMQKQITSGNFSTLVRFLLDLQKRFNPKKVEKKDQNGHQELNLKKLQVLQSYEEAENFLELVIMIISDTLNLTPKQTLSTLNEQAKYFAHMVVKGIKNSFTQIIDMLQVFIKQLPKIMFFCEKNPAINTEFLLDLVKPTLISRDSDVAKKGAQLFRNVMEESLKYNTKNLIYQILTKETVGFDFLYMAIKRHPNLIHEFTPFIFLMVGQSLPDFFEVHLKRTINNQQQFMKIVLRLFEGFVAVPESKLKIKESGMLNIWISNCNASFNNKVSKEEGAVNEETKLLYLELLCSLWKEYSAQIDQQEAESLLSKGIYQLKKNTRNQIYTIKIPALLRLFDFLHFLADSKNRMASILYKQLIFLFIQNHEQTEIRQIFLNNFSVMLQQYPTIPAEFLLDPLLKQLQNSQGKSYILNVFDFQFLVQLCRHPKMDVSYGLSYLKYLTRLYIKSYIYARLTARVIKILTSRFCEEETIIQFLKKTVDNTLNQYGILTFNKKKGSKEDAIINKQKQSLSIELIKHFIQLEHQQLRNFILNKVTGLYLLWLESKNHKNKGLKYLIEFYGDLEEICLQYKIKQNNKTTETPPSPHQSQEESYTKPTPKSQAYHELQYMKQKGIGYREERKPNRTHADSRLGLNSNALKPAPKALEDLQKIKQKLKDDANRRKQFLDNELRRLKQKSSANSLELMQRNLSLGYAKLTPTQENQILFDFDSVKQKQLKMTIKFHTLDQLQDIDKSSAKTILKLHGKQIKSLFLKYALISNAQNSRIQDSTVMSFTAAIKMLNEKGMGSINKLVVGDLIASINSNKRKEKNILYGVEQNDFNQFLLRLTDYLVQTEKNSLQVPFGLRLEALLKTLFSFERFFQHKVRTNEDQKIAKIKEAINSGQEDTQFLIPEGYKKVKENRVELTYMIADSDWGVDQKYKIGHQLADWLIFRSLGIHVITPLVSIEQRFNLISIPKPLRMNISKQQTDPNIKNEPEIDQTGNAPREKVSHQRYYSKNKNTKTYQRRSQSQRTILRTKGSPQQTEEDKQKEAKKREQHVIRLKQNLERLRQEKALKEEEEKRVQTEKQEKQKKKQEQRKRYMELNKEKIKNYKEKEDQSERQKQQEQKIKKEKYIQDQKRKEKQLFEKHKENIKKIAGKSIEKTKKIEHSRDKILKQTEKNAKQPPPINQLVEADKVRMAEVKTSLENGTLKEIVNQYQKQLTQLFQAYWIWDKKRIDLNSMALMLKDFNIIPDYVSPKVLAETFKPMSKGQPLDYSGFVECLLRCGYRSKLVQDGEGGSSVDPSIARQLLDLLKMKQWNYKEVIRRTKNHLG